MGVDLDIEAWNKATAERAKTYSAMKTAEANLAEKKKAFATASAACQAMMTGEKKRGRKAAGATA